MLFLFSYITQGHVPRHGNTHIILFPSPSVTKKMYHRGVHLPIWQELFFDWLPICKWFLLVSSNLKLESAIKSLGFKRRAGRDDYSNYKLGMILNNYWGSYCEKKLEKGESAFKGLVLLLGQRLCLPDVWFVCLGMWSLDAPRLRW